MYPMIVAPRWLNSGFTVAANSIIGTSPMSKSRIRPAPRSQSAYVSAEAKETARNTGCRKKTVSRMTKAK